MIHHGNLFDVLPTLDAESIDACVTDPPYGIGFLSQGRWMDEWHAAPTQPAGEPIEDWFDECRRLHNRACNGRYGHSIQMGIDKEKAKREAS